ncbi:Spc97_Spc98-domain-containing protein [Fragilariopsis cylindrus CCMP1102]|uniref:Spc97_Spc98-domain-containing protein n=1 Tax=Fragilariopsis cylindrus CCMP1102 TaxID=635003 RepID=A0A1E7FK91_9STRA|nr:Spc97_Spc98-domain-containing protein [Fragilariopsis cylindrus CCMP1102]|eukprot:OEU18600.1 Spc97_Spc98-domain-containing protein [Fragilariopsis cylindrus CCMP1102]
MTYIDPGDCSDDDDPVHRLVRAIVGSSNDGHVISLAERVLGSQIGTKNDNSGTRRGGGSSSSSHNNVDLSSTWRRISRKVRDPKSKEEIEQLYRLYEQETEAMDDPHLPSQVITTLTKLMGKKIPMCTSNSKTLSTNAGEMQSMRKKIENAENEGGNNFTTSSASASTPAETEEEILLRECLYSLQGINGDRIRYYIRDQNDNNLPDASNYEGIRINSPAITQNLLYTGQVSETRLGSGALDALKICGEAGWLYSRIQSYIHHVQQDRTKGVVARAFAETLAEQLRDYHSLLTTYETKLPGFTLRQMLVELRGPTFRLKTLAMLVDGLQEFRGGHLLSALHKHSIHGNTVHANIVKSILHKASRPWFEILYAWTTKGVLSDPWNEFFVVVNKNVDDKHLWKNKYRINQDQVPNGILDLELVKPAFNVGKGINFIRRCLLDGQWTMQIQNDATDIGGTADGENEMENVLGYKYQSHENGNLENIVLQKTLNSAARLVHSHILCTLKEENHLMQHLFALKQFLLLGQGDFFSALTEGLYNEFKSSSSGESSGVKEIYKHSLLIIVEGALRGSNAKHLPQYIIERLQVELILDPGEEMDDMRGPAAKLMIDNNKPTRDHRNIYDIFMLDYQVPDPVIAIVHAGALDRYKMVFSLLFRVKKIEFMLNLTWRQSATLQHALQISAQHTGIDVSSSTGYAKATFLLRNISILRQSMTHLIVNLKSYLMFEVIEGGWQRLQSAINEATTLDEAIEAHDNYLDTIIRKAMVRVQERDEFPQQNLLAGQVEIVLDIANEFCDLQEKLFDRSLKEAEIVAQKRLDAESRLKKGEWGFDSQKDIAEQETFFGLASSSVSNEVSKISDNYNNHAVSLLSALSDSVDGNAKSGKLDMYDGGGLHDDDLHPQRFLIAQLDHNDFYANQELR